MNKLSGICAIAILLAASLGCSTILNRALSSGQNFTRVDNLWADVPRIEGLQPTKATELPLEAKAMALVVMNTFWKEEAGADQQASVNGSWLGFTTDATMFGIQSYYSAERMLSSGQWTPVKNGGCSKDDEVRSAALCVYKKSSGGHVTLLAIMGSDDAEKKGVTNICFLRLESDMPTEAAPNAPQNNKKSQN